MTKANKNKSTQNVNVIIHNEKVSELRINKFISETGFCSRREADKLINQGKVTVNGN